LTLRTILTNIILSLTALFLHETPEPEFASLVSFPLYLPVFATRIKILMIRPVLKQENKCSYNNQGTQSILKINYT